MTFADNILSQSQSDSIGQDFALPRRHSYHPSPADWQDEAFYFLLVDRFNDDPEETRPPLDRGNLTAARPEVAGAPWRRDRWAKPGGERWQSGMLPGDKSRLGYLERLGVNAIWLSAVFNQRGHLDIYHGYGIQDFLDELFCDAKE